MAKNKRRGPQIGKKQKEIERGYRVVSAKTGQPVYPASHPDGLPKAEAERLSEGLLMPTEVVSISGE